jgi:hypothetical protein
MLGEPAEDVAVNGGECAFGVEFDVVHGARCYRRGAENAEKIF